MTDDISWQSYFTVVHYTQLHFTRKMFHHCGASLTKYMPQQRYLTSSRWSPCSVNAAICLARVATHLQHTSHDDMIYEWPSLHSIHLKHILWHSAVCEQAILLNLQLVDTIHAYSTFALTSVLVSFTPIVQKRVSAFPPAISLLALYNNFRIFEAVIQTFVSATQPAKSAKVTNLQWVVNLSKQTNHLTCSLSQSVIKAFRATPLEETTHKHSLSHLEL